jgi:hypothetical protein
LLLFCSFVVVIFVDVVVVGAGGGGGGGPEPCCATFALTEVRNTLKQETHLSCNSICTSYHSETIATVSLLWE